MNLNPVAEVAEPPPLPAMSLEEATLVAEEEEQKQDEEELTEDEEEPTEDEEEEEPPTEEEEEEEPPAEEEEPTAEEPTDDEEQTEADPIADVMEGGSKKKLSKKPKPKPKPKPTTVAPDDDRPRVTMPWLSKYEFTRVLSDRTEMLARGAVPFVRLPPDFAIKTNMELREVALRELELGRVPFKLRRTLPDGTVEVWRLGELDIPRVFLETAHMYDVNLGESD